MSFSLKRISLSSQVAELVLREIDRGRWQERLPGEREMSMELQVSRGTCRRALNQLERQGLLERRQGQRTRILQLPRSTSAVSHSVGFLIPEPIGALRPLLALWIDELRARLFESQITLRLHHGSNYYTANPNGALQRLTRQSPHGCWVLANAPRPMQRWFEQSGLPCVVAGSTYDRIQLDSVDIDYRALCRHAVGQLLARGHRNIVFINKKSRGAGDLESEAGFLEGVAVSKRGELHATISYHQESLSSVAQIVRRLLASARPPTGIIVANSYCYLATVTVLSQLGKRVPGDFSVISRDSDAFLNFIEPQPARYVASPQELARNVLQRVLAHLSPTTVLDSRRVRILPQFLSGGSLATPAPGPV